MKEHKTLNEWKREIEENLKYIKNSSRYRHLKMSGSVFQLEPHEYVELADYETQVNLYTEQLQMIDNIIEMINDTLKNKTEYYDYNHNELFSCMGANGKRTPYIKEKYIKDLIGE